MIPIKEFIFTSGIWRGHGKIALTSSSESLSFYTKWIIEEENNHCIRAVQSVEIEGVSEKTINHLSFIVSGKDCFLVTIKNQFIKEHSGIGIREKERIRWSFSHPQIFEGNENYQLQKGGEYTFCATYGSSFEFQTIAKGVIWLSDFN